MVKIKIKFVEGSVLKGKLTVNRVIRLLKQLKINPSGVNNSNLINMEKETTPILVANTEWDLPKTLIADVKSERMINGLIDMAKPNTLEKEDLVGWAEVVAYLMPATQKSVVRSDVADIYLYCCNKLMERKGIKDIDFLENHKKISDYQMKKLNEIKRWIYNKRGGKEKTPVLNALKEVFLENN
jgi:hypothetical protein